MMSTYNYKCLKCGHTFEKTMPIGEHERHPKQKCPKCNSRQVEQVPAAFQAVTSKKS